MTVDNLNPVFVVRVTEVVSDNELCSYMASGCANNPVQYGKLRDLSPTTKPPPLQVIVHRTWEVQVSNADTLDFIIMDTDGDQMHGWIPRKLVPTYETEIYENNIVTIRNFNVIEKRKKYYSPLRAQYNIVFTENTKVDHVQEYVHFPPEQFNFTEFDQLQPMIGKKNFLSDVIGMFEFVGKTRQVSSTKKLRELYIRNERDETLKVNFWDGDIRLILASLTNGGPTPILAITSTTVTNFGGRIGVNISQGTKIWVDPHIPPADELRRKITAPSPGKPEKRLLTSDAPRTIKDIRTAIAKGTTGYNLCRASVQQVYEDEGWKYSSCTTCRKKVTLSGADYWCFCCNAKETNPDERFKLQIQLADRHGLLDVTVFSEAASELLDISLAEMNNLTKNHETGTEEVHNQLMKAIGKEYLFRVRVDDYNVQNPDKALTVSSISNITAPPSKRIRTVPPCARQLPFSASDEATPTAANQTEPTNSVICSQDSSSSDLCPHPPSTPNATGAGASTSHF